MNSQNGIPKLKCISMIYIYIIFDKSKHRKTNMSKKEIEIEIKHASSKF